ncbi:AEC family transporter [Acetobacteraceae bacterium KSS8]|uniref:AEC family transporter n=1 Tax=Endosaccharibacter trunci TaxID=2812733 RepID=A0ABT1W965_9PROT|nr:AEC family transporter [Acetobacteraceae bacterium KSS8]
MQAVLSVLLPIFALILAGFVAGRLGWLGDGATNSLNRFVVRLALPAELFQSMAQVTGSQIDHPGFLLCFGAAMLTTFGIGLALDLRRPVLRANKLSGAVIEGLAAGYANTAFMGIPLCLGVFGEAGLPPVILATLLTVCALFALAIALVELDLQSGHGTARTLLTVGIALIRNPLVAAPIAGAVVNLSGLTLGAPVLRFTGLLGDAASPCALVTIGLFLAEPMQGSAPMAALARVVALKLLFQPAMTAILALFVFHLPSLWSRSAILISALPVGTGPFMLARLYEREPGVASRATLISTVLSLITVSLLLSWID